MVSKKNSLVIAAVATICVILTMAYGSCTKPLQNAPYSCIGVTCTNGGYCDSSRCICPTGYEGADCSVIKSARFYGTWSLSSKVIGSDSANVIGVDTTYTVVIRASATPTTFLMNNFASDPYYNNIICTIDSNSASNFVIDTISSSLNMVYDHYRIMPGSWGSLINGPTGDTIKGVIRVRHLNSTVNWQNDTMRLQLLRQ